MSTQTRKRTLRQALDAVSENSLGTLLSKVRLGSFFTPLKRVFTGLTSASSFDLTLIDASGEGTGPSNAKRLPASFISSLRVVTAAGGVTGTYVVGDVGATPIIPPDQDPSSPSRALIALAGVTDNINTVVEAINTGTDGNALRLTLVGDNDPMVLATKDLGLVAPGDLDTIVRSVPTGVAGNAVSVRLLMDGTPGAQATKDLGTVGTGQLDSVVDAVAGGPGGNAITVALVMDGAAATKAELALSALGAYNAVVRARVAGTGGNSITVALVMDGTPGSRAELNCTPLGDNKFDVVLESVNTGAFQNNISVYMEASGSASVTDVDEITTRIRYVSGVSTVADIEALIPSSAIVRVKTSGTGATVLIGPSAFTYTSLAGAADGTALSIGEVGSAVTIHLTPGETNYSWLDNRINNLSALIEIKTGSSPVYQVVKAPNAFAATALASGTAAAPPTVTEVGDAVTLHATNGVTTVAQMESAITAESTKIEVGTAGTGATVLVTGDAFAATALAGGSSGTAANVTEIGSAVTLHGTNGETTVALMEAAITALATKITVGTAGTAGTVLNSGSAFAVQSLAGGLDGEGVTVIDATPNITVHYVPDQSTVTQFQATVNTSTLIRVKTAGTGGNILDAGDELVSQAFTTGTDPEAAASVGIASISDDGKTVTFPAAVTAFTISYLPRMADMDARDETAAP